MELLFLPEKLTLIQVNSGDPLFIKALTEHYPKSKGIVGRRINYWIVREGEVIGVIGACSPPKRYKKFVEYFQGIDERYYLNNNIFRLFIREKNLGTKVLKLFRQRIKEDYKVKYGDELVGLVTFVEPPRTGSVYKADNWDFLGCTQGVGRRRPRGKCVRMKGVTPKLIFARKI